MKIRDLTVEQVIEEIDELQQKPMTWDTVQWLAALMTIKHRLQKIKASTESYQTLSKAEAKDWVASMHNGHGQHGEHWNCVQTKGLFMTHNFDCDEWEFYAVINALYCDFGKVLAEFGIPDTNTTCYAKLARAWLRDDDAKEHKAMRYYKNVVE